MSKQNERDKQIVPLRGRTRALTICALTRGALYRVVENCRTPLNATTLLWVYASVASPADDVPPNLPGLWLTSYPHILPPAFRSRAASIQTAKHLSPYQGSRKQSL